MKKIGLIGGMSFESSNYYNRLIHELMREKLGGRSCARIIQEDFNLQEIYDPMQSGNWNKIADMVKESAKRLESSGAECILICTNTVHKVFNYVQRNLKTAKLLHIADPVAAFAKERGLTKLGLLGTRITMQESFYSYWLNKHGINVIAPDDLEEIGIIDRIIFDELCKGIIKESSRENLCGSAYSLKAKGAQGIILGCTELPLILKQEDLNIPLINTLELHARAAVDFALESRQPEEKLC